MIGPPELHWGWASVDARGPSSAGQRAAADALARLDPALRLAYTGPRPVVAGAPDVAISVSHGRACAAAVTGCFTALGLDLCELTRGARIRALAARFLTAGECALLVDDRAAAAVWAAKEAGLKALGLGLLDGGVFDDPAACPVRVAWLDPPRYAQPPHLALSLGERDGVIVALAIAPRG
jgi:phosphopantetheinyl transferase (holo-ACP synthase)